MKRKGNSTAVIDADVDERIDWERQQRERFRQAIEEIGELNKNWDPEEVMRIVTEEVEAVRQEHNEKERQTDRGRC